MSVLTPVIGPYQMAMAVTGNLCESRIPVFQSSFVTARPERQRDDVEVLTKGGHLVARSRSKMFARIQAVETGDGRRN
jgi:hypothetical protein